MRMKEGRKEGLIWKKMGGGEMRGRLIKEGAGGERKT